VRTLEADQLHTRQQQASAKQAMQDQLAIEEQRQLLRQREQELQWQQELRKLDQAREERYARWKGDYEVLLAQQSHELARMDAMHRISDTAKLATAAGPNVQALAQVMGLQIQAGMDAGQIHAHAQVVRASRQHRWPLPQRRPVAATAMCCAPAMAKINFVPPVAWLCRKPASLVAEPEADISKHDADSKRPDPRTAGLT
jgi:hypothetical protein